MGGICLWLLETVFVPFTNNNMTDCGDNASCGDTYSVDVVIGEEYE